MRAVDTPPVRFVTLSVSELETLLARAARLALSEHQKGRAVTGSLLSPRAVARLARIRDERVYRALAAGALVGTRNAGGRYRIPRAAADAWIASLVKYGYRSES